MIRNISSVIIGIIVGLFAIMALHQLGMVFYPLPEGVDMNDSDAIAEYIKIAPLGALLLVMFAHLGGTFLAAVASTFISKEKNICFIIGSVFTIFGLMNLYQLPHPMWFNIEAVLYLPSAYLGYTLIAIRN